MPDNVKQDEVKQDEKPQDKPRGVKNKALIPQKDDKGNVTIHNTECDKSEMPINKAAETLSDDPNKDVRMPYNVYKDPKGNLTVVNPESEKGGFDNPEKDKAHREAQAKELHAKQIEERKSAQG